MASQLQRRRTGTATLDNRSAFTTDDREILSAILHQRRTEDRAVAEQFATRASDDRPHLAQASQALLAVEDGYPSLTVTRSGMVVTFYGSSLSVTKLENRLGLTQITTPNFGNRISELFAAERLNGAASDQFREVIGHLGAGRHRALNLSDLRQDGVTGYLATGVPFTATQRQYLNELRDAPIRKVQSLLDRIHEQHEELMPAASEVAQRRRQKALSRN